MRKKAIIYGRVSTVGQADDGISTESQVEAGRRKAADMDADVVRVFVDDGISARTAKREDFQRAVTFCYAMKIDYFIIWHSNRFFRNHVEAALYKRDLRKAGTELVYIANPIDHRDPNGWFIEGMYELIDEKRSHEIGQDTLRSMMSNARGGYFNGGRVPFGYRVIQEGKRRRLEIDEREAAVYRGIVDAFLQGSGTKLIALSLNASGQLQRGRLWSKNAIAAMLKSEVYTGHLVFNRRGRDRQIRPASDWIRTKAHPEIISAETHEMILQLMHVRAPRVSGGAPRSNFLFTGMLKCGACRQGLQTESATGRGGEVYHYYNCRGAQKGHGCPPRRMPAGEFDAWLSGHLLEHVLAPDTLREILLEIYRVKGDWAKDRERRRAAVVAEIREAEQRRRNLYDVLELHGRAAPNLGDLSTRLRELTQQIRALEGSLDAIEREGIPEPEMHDADLQALSSFVRELFDGCQDPKRIRAFFATFVDTITVGDELAEIVYRPERLIQRPVVAVHSGIQWLPDLGSNQGPAD